MDIRSRSLSRSILLAGAVGPPSFVFWPCSLVFKGDMLCPPVFCYPKQRVGPRTASRDENVVKATARGFLICAWPSLVGVFGGGGGRKQQ